MKRGMLQYAMYACSEWLCFQVAEVMPFDLRHYANILRLLRLLRAARPVH